MFAGALVDHGPHGVVDDHEFVYAGASLVSEFVFVGSVERRRVPRVGAQELAFVIAGGVRRARLRIQHPDKPLSQNADQAGREQERFHAHVAQSRDGAHRRVGVQRRQHQVAGQAGLHGNLRGFKITNLPDHHHVGILPEDGPKPPGEGHVDLGIDLGLADPVDVVLDGVFHREDIASEVVDPFQRRVERGGLAGTGGPGDQEDAVGTMNQFVHPLLVAPGHAQVRQLETPGLLVQQAQHHALAVAGRDGGDAHINRAAGDPQRDTAVLGQTFLGDVQLGHDLDARHHQRRHGAAGLQDLLQHAVDPESDCEAVLVGLDVDIRGVFLHGLGEDRVDEANDGRLVVAFQQVGRLG